jgi:SAM-dependent methyltransferase
LASPADDESALPDSLTSKNVRFSRGNIYDEPGWYDVDYAGYRGEEAFYRLVLSKAVKPGGVVVELGTGTGRLALRFAADGFRVHGVEPSDKMRGLFEEKRDKAGVDVVNEDATAATFAGPRAGRVDVVMFPFNGLLHVKTREEMLASFRHVREKLDDDGRFALDITGPYWDSMLYGPTAWGRSDERTHPLSGKLVHTGDRSAYDASTRQMRIDIRYVVDGEKAGAEITLLQTMWTWQQVLGALNESGFAVDLLFGDVDMAPFDEGATRMLVSCRKQ